LRISLRFSIQILLERREEAQSASLEFPDPAIGDGVDRHRGEKVQFFAPPADRHDQRRRCEWLRQ
jgi:hypothetical protein